MSKTYVLQNPATVYSMLLVLCILYIVCFREQIGVLLIPIIIPWEWGVWDFCQQVQSFSQIGLQASGKMKSVGNGGILNGSLQMLHIHVLFVTPLGTSHMA